MWAFLGFAELKKKTNTFLKFKKHKKEMAKFYFLTYIVVTGILMLK